MIKKKRNESVDLDGIDLEKQDVIKKRILSVAIDGRIECAKAIGIAKSLHISPNVVGMIADQIEVRIKGCQLGCF